MFSNKDKSLCIDIMIFTLRNEVLSPSWKGMLTLLWYEVLNATGISTWSAIRADPEYLYIFNQYKNRMETNKAIVRTARKLANRVYFTLREVSR